MKMKTKVKRKKKMNLTFTLPDELIVEILLRLPVRSLLRFKCVCKSWLTLISDPLFAKSQFDLAAPTYGLFLEPAYPLLPVTIDTEASLHDDSAIVHLTVPHPSSPSLNSYCFQIYGFCRGFILLRYNRDDNFILWNPSTSAHRLIPYPQYMRNNEFLYGFGYDSSKDDYLVVMWVLSNSTGETNIHFLSFKTNSWNKTEGINFPHREYLEEISRAGLFFNGALHWLACSNGSDRVNEIVAFDLTERSLLEIPVPHNLTMVMRTKLYNLVVIGGCLSLCKGWGTHTGAIVEIWKLKEYKVQSSWTMISVQYTCDIKDNFSPVWFTKGGDIVVGSSYSGVLMKLNDKGELLEYRRHSPLLVAYMFLRRPQSATYSMYSPFLVPYMLLWRPQPAMYRQSLLSLPDLGKAKDQH